MKWLAALAACLLVAGGAYLLFRDDPQSKVEVQAGGSLPPALNRADDYGADTLRGYLRAVLRCDARMKAHFARADPALDAVFADACEPSRAQAIEGEVADERLDDHGRALWRLSADGGRLPKDLYVWIAQRGGSDWMVDTACRPLSGCSGHWE
jgi:hypothetical protein